MTRSSTTPSPLRKPDTISFGELAIAAGSTGSPVAVCFSESAATLTCQIWKYFAQLAGSERVIHIHGQTDVRELKDSIGHWRLVFVHTPRLFNTVAWTVQMHESGTLARPTIFSGWIPGEVDDVPIPLLTLRDTPGESSSIIRWLMARPQLATLPGEPSLNGVTFDPSLTAVTIPNHLPHGRGPTRLRDCQLLTALLSGACLVRNGEQSSIPADSPTCGQREYEQVQRLLQSPLVNTSDEPVNQLAIDMVDRANVYLEMKSNAEFIHAHPTLCADHERNQRQDSCRTRQELVSRREVADLGNVHCRLIRQIVDFLRDARDGQEVFQRMGLVCRSPSERKFKRTKLRSLTMMLRPWSQKQVRTHFDSLRKSGWITGERQSANAPWQYQLPEQISSRASPFHSLPAANELMSVVTPST